MNTLTKIYKIVLIVGAAALLSAIFIGCDMFGLGGNDDATVALSIKGVEDTSDPVSSVASRSITSTDGAVLEFSEAYIAIGKIEFKKLGETTEESTSEEEITEGEGTEEETTEEETAETELDIDFEGPFVVDLMAGTSVPDLGEAVIDPGTYVKAEMELVAELENGLSVLITGTYTPAEGEAVDWEFSYAGTEDFKVENAEGFEVSEGGVNNLLILFNLDDWFNGVDLSLAVADTDGVLRLNKDINNDIADIVESNLEAAGSVGKDSNNDGDIED